MLQTFQMAKINNTDVIQKLVDELNLQVGSDIIPNETADKILPVFQINSDVVEVSAPTANIVRSGTAGGGSATIYTTPSTGEFYLTNVHFSISADSIASDATGEMTIDIDGTTQDLIKTKMISGSTQTENISLNLQNPIKIDAGSNIVISTTLATLDVEATIVGYTQD